MYESPVYFIMQGLLFAGLSTAGIIFSDRLTAYKSFLLGGLVMSLAVLLLIPFIVVFAVIMVISNLALIRHEGFRFANTLGFYWDRKYLTLEENLNCIL